MKGDARVIELLNETLKNELTAVNQYWLHYRLLDNWGIERLAAFERHESIDEMKHADRLAERILYLEHGKPLLFGAQKDKGIRFDGNFQPEIVSGSSLGSAFVWDETAVNVAPAMALATMSEQEFPVPVGVFRRLEKPTYETAIHEQIRTAQQKKKESLRDLLRAGEIWDVK